MKKLLLTLLFTPLFFITSCDNNSSVSTGPEAYEGVWKLKEKENFKNYTGLLYDRIYTFNADTYACGWYTDNNVLYEGYRGKLTKISSNLFSTETQESYSMIRGEYKKMDRTVINYFKTDFDNNGNLLISTSKQKDGPYEDHVIPYIKQ